MTSLTDVYEGRVGRVATRRQQLLGTGLFLAGVVSVVTAIAVATTGIGAEAMGTYAARQLAGVLAGLGLPAVLLGVFAVLPATRQLRAGGVIGTSVAALGVALFTQAYPYEWVASAPLLALATTTVYALGVVTIVWCLFVALATFKTRNDPGGTARMEITREGRIRLVEEARSFDLSGVGVFGTDPDGGVETQTNRDTDRGGASGADGAARGPDGGTASVGETAEPTAPEPSADGGTASVGGSDDGPGRGPAEKPADDAEFLTAAETRGRPDVYCGNCRHFEYQMSDGEPIPYCQLHEERMDDMEACSGWVEQSVTSE